MKANRSAPSDRATELAEFLRTRRAKISPAQAGLSPSPTVRRVPGLRREEVARLAGVSVDYYVRLERGHNVNLPGLKAGASVLCASGGVGGCPASTLAGGGAV
jgi:hypothetical protein